MSEGLSPEHDVCRAAQSAICVVIVVSHSRPVGLDHVHALVDAPPAVHGEQIRELLKRWSTQALDTRWPRPPNGRWWAKGGSNKPVKDESYLNRAFPYVHSQRA